jgi:hypothetical protein
LIVAAVHLVVANVLYEVYARTGAVYFLLGSCLPLGVAMHLLWTIAWDNLKNRTK